MLDFSENGDIPFTQEDLEMIEELQRDERIIMAIRTILEKRNKKN